jgi:hypothetical protein
MLKLFEVTVCALRRFGLACRCKSEVGREIGLLEEVAVGFGVGCWGRGGILGEAAEFGMALVLASPCRFPLPLPK